MSADVTVIGRSSFVRGRISGTGSLEIAGRIEGEVSVTGDIAVEATGLVAANLSAQRITVRGGAVKGDLTAEDGIVLEAGARVVGDLHAPRVSIAEGALVRGHVQTGQTGAGDGAQRSASKKQVPQAPFRERAAAQPSISSISSKSGAVTSRHPTATSVAKAPPPPPPSRGESVKKSVPAANANSSHGMPRGSVLAGTRPQASKAPPPVVPVLKKGAKATQKKRA